jgi:hypothetical protein
VIICPPGITMTTPPAVAAFWCAALNHRRSAPGVHRRAIASATCMHASSHLHGPDCGDRYLPKHIQIRDLKRKLLRTMIVPESRPSSYVDGPPRAAHPVDTVSPQSQSVITQKEGIRNEHR